MSGVMEAELLAELERLRRKRRAVKAELDQAADQRRDLEQDIQTISKNIAKMDRSLQETVSIAARKVGRLGPGIKLKARFLENVRRIVLSKRSGDILERARENKRKAARLYYDTEERMDICRKQLLSLDVKIEELLNRLQQTGGSSGEG